MVSTSQRRKCCNDPDIFYYICGCFTLKHKRRNIMNFVKRVYLDYFKIPLENHDKSWIPHKMCKACLETLQSWSQRKNAKLMLTCQWFWREPTKHLHNCYFCLVNVKGFNKKTNNTCNTQIPHQSFDQFPIMQKYLRQNLLSYQRLRM